MSHFLNFSFRKGLRCWISLTVKDDRKNSFRVISPTILLGKPNDYFGYAAALFRLVVILICDWIELAV